MVPITWTASASRSPPSADLRRAAAARVQWAVAWRSGASRTVARGAAADRWGPEERMAAPAALRRSWREVYPTAPAVPPLEEAVRGSAARQPAAVAPRPLV